MRRAAHRAVRETAANVHLISVAPQPTGERCPDFTVLSMSDGQRCITIDDKWIRSGSVEERRCKAILAEEVAMYRQTCGQCLNSGVTQEGFDALYARNEEAKVRLAQALAHDAREKSRWWVPLAVGIIAASGGLVSLFFARYLGAFR